MTKYKEGDLVTIRLGKEDLTRLEKHGFSQINHLHIVRHERAPETIVGYVNVYKGSALMLHPTEVECDFNAADDRIACLKITYNPATNEASAEVCDG